MDLLLSLIYVLNFKKIEKYKLDGFIQKLDGDLFGYYLKCANGDYFNEVEENKS